MPERGKEWAAAILAFFNQRLPVSNLVSSDCCSADASRVEPSAQMALSEDIPVLFGLEKKNVCKRDAFLNNV
jgi:hypothetical protein